MIKVRAVSKPTGKINFKRHRLNPQIIAHVVWLYARFNLSLREVEARMQERGVDLSSEEIRHWTRPMLTERRPAWSSSKEDQEMIQWINSPTNGGQHGR